MNTLNTHPAPGAPPPEKWANIGDLRVRYLDWGGHGVPVILLHGLASSAHWYDLVAPLLRDQCRIIAPDQRGHGQTSQAPGGYDWGTLAKDVVGLMDHLDVSEAAVFGHSWGANVALNVAARFPDRVSALGLIDGGFSRGSGTRGTWEEVRALHDEGFEIGIHTSSSFWTRRASSRSPKPPTARTATSSE